MKKAIIIYILVILFPFGLNAQKKEIIAARDYIKSGKNLNKAQESMEKLLKDSSNRENIKIWNTLYDAVQLQYEQGNEKLYLKQKYDTAAFFNYAKYLFQIAIAMDTVDSKPDKKGRIDPSYREKHSEYLNQIRPNLFNGGAWFIKKQDFKVAYQFFDMYVDCYRQPLFKDYKYSDNDNRLAEASYWSVYCGYKMQDARATLHNSYTALKDTAHNNYMLQYLAETYKLENDTMRYLMAITEGFNKYPKFPYFFPRLVEFYSEANKLESSLTICEDALKSDPENELFLFTKSTILLNMNREKECISICEKLIEKNDSLSEAYYNAGLAYFNMAVSLDKETQKYRHNRNLIMENYKKAEGYLEKYRSLAPDAKRKWSLPLYTIYLNLNKGEEFDEIDKILKNEN